METIKVKFETDLVKLQFVKYTEINNLIKYNIFVAGNPCLDLIIRINYCDEIAEIRSLNLDNEYLDIEEFSEVSDLIKECLIYYQNQISNE